MTFPPLHPTSSHLACSQARLSEARSRAVGVKAVCLAKKASVQSSWIRSSARLSGTFAATGESMAHRLDLTAGLQGDLGNHRRVLRQFGKRIHPRAVDGILFREAVAAEGVLVSRRPATRA